MENHLIDTPKRTIYKPDPYRFVILPIFCTYSVFIGLFMNPYAPIAKCMNIAFGITVSQIILTMICFLVGKIISAPISGILLERVGIKPGIYVSLLLMSFGLFLRTLLDVSFIFVLMGQLLLGLSAALVTSGQMKILYEWFHPAVRGYFTTIVSLSFTIGGGLGLIVILLFLKDTETNSEAIKLSIDLFDQAHLIFVLLLAIIHTLLFLSKPRRGYGYQVVSPDVTVPEAELVTATEKVENSTQTFKEQFLTMFHQRGFKLLLAMYILFNGINLFNASTITIVYEEFGFYSYKKSALIFGTLISGAIGSAFFIKVYLPLPNSRYYYSNSILLALIACALNILSYVTGMPFFVVLLMQMFYGSSFFLGIPVAVEYIIRNVKDVPLTFVNGFIFFFAQSFACVLLLINRAIFALLEGFQRQAIYCSWAVIYLVLIVLAVLSRQETGVSAVITND